MLYNQELKNLKKPSADTLNKVKKAISEIKEELKQSGDMDAVGIAYDKDEIKDIKEFAEFMKNKFKHIVVMGIGGSSLGAKTLCALKDNAPVTILENIDSHSIELFFNSLDLKNTGFITVSKSGKTIECISQTLIIMKRVEDELGKDKIKDHFVFLTEDKDSPLTQLAQELGIKTLPHHKTVGGRFSYLSNVGLIPAAISGLNIEDIRNGAAEVIDYVLNNEDNFISEVCAMQVELYTKEGITENVLMTYVERLQNLTEWYRQLWAESLGKGGFGVTPIDALGTVDQHSQLQLYMDGPHNKFYSFFLKEKDSKALKITKSYNAGFDYLLNKSLDDIMDIEAKSTVEVLNKRGLPVRVFTFKELNEKALSQILMQYMLETIIVGKALGINPFGQQAVEERKILAREMMKNL